MIFLLILFLESQRHIISTVRKDLVVSLHSRFLLFLFFYFPSPFSLSFFVHFFAFVFFVHKGMVDYQHVLSVHADVARRKKRNWADMEPQFGYPSTFMV